MVLTWSRGCEGAHRCSCDRKLLASRLIQQAIFSVDFYHLECLIQVLLVCSSVNNARPQLRCFWLRFCRRSKGIGIFKLPIASDENHCKWREAWLSEITKTRVMDQDFRNQITNDRVYTCEKHVNPEDIEICK